MVSTGTLYNRRSPPPHPCCALPITLGRLQGWSLWIIHRRYKGCGKLLLWLWKDCGIERPPSLSKAPPPGRANWAPRHPRGSSTPICPNRKHLPAFAGWGPPGAACWHTSCLAGKNALKRAMSPNTRTDTESICASSTSDGIQYVAWFLPFRTRRNPPEPLRFGGVVCGQGFSRRFRYWVMDPLPVLLRS